MHKSSLIFTASIVLFFSLLLSPGVSYAQSGSNLNTKQVAESTQYMTTDQLRSLVNILSDIVKRLRTQINTDNPFDDVPENQIYADSFKGQQFTLQTKYTGSDMWRYRITGRLPSPCWDYEVQHTGFTNDTIRFVTYPPEQEKNCESVVSEVEKLGTIQSGPGIGFGFYVTEFKGDDKPSSD